MKFKVNFDGKLLDDVELDIHVLTAKERVVRSAKAFGQFFGVAILCVFVPVFHFVLVPVALIIAVVMGFRKYQETLIIKQSEFLCPGCGKSILTKQPSLHAANPSLRLFCNSCLRTTTLQKISEK